MQKTLSGGREWRAQVKEEGWWLVLGDVASQELHAIKRLSFAERTTARLEFPAHTSAGAPVTSVVLHLVRPACNVLFTPFTTSLRCSWPRVISSLLNWCSQPAKAAFHPRHVQVVQSACKFRTATNLTSQT